MAVLYFSMSPRFQFTHPGRGATEESLASMADGEFQFTHPGRGATSDPDAEIPPLLRFQFTHPGRGATQRKA